MFAVTPLGIRIYFVIDLPTRYPFMTCERFGKLGNDNAVLLPHDGRGLAGMTARRNVCADQIVHGHARFGVLVQEPAGRRCRGRAEHRKYTVFV